MEKIKLGVLGGYRGLSMINYCVKAQDVELVAICDYNDEVLASCEKWLKERNANVKLFKNFDEFIEEDLDGVVLANYANEHAPFAIRCMEKGKHVMSECLPVQTLAQAVALCEAVEKTGKIYYYAENYCFFPATIEMRRLYKEGKLGEFEYGEGEYLHDCESIWPSITYGDRNHWRNAIHAFYYVTHSMGPLVHITGLRPVRVSGFSVPHNDKARRMGAQGESYAIEMVTMENGGIVRSAHGLGPSRNSIWYSIYGTKGRIESGREGYSHDLGEVHLLVDDEPLCVDGSTKSYDTRPAEFDKARDFGHWGGDYYTMKNFVKAIRGEEDAELIDVYEALDMYFPGHFAHLSFLEGGKPMDIPNFRNKEEREPYRNDNRSCDPKVSKGEDFLAPNREGVIDYPQELYDKIRDEYLNSKK
ncbi:MAG: Gfo/Idh/MocA family oxidoreductase [Clostridia bacterium]|nr:Gfo/Idh/MocA family oxidoreductase [Clostridia bacterium]